MQIHSLLNYAKMASAKESKISIKLLVDANKKTVLAEAGKELICRFHLQLTDL